MNKSYNFLYSALVKGQSWGFTSRSTARVILGQVLRIATCVYSALDFINNELWNATVLNIIDIVEKKQVKPKIV